MVNKMNAVVCDGAGGVEVMRWEQVAMPEPLVNAAAQVRIKVHAAGLNRPDVLQRAGLYAPPADASPYLGLEVAGEVVEVLGHSEWAVGDKVCALVHGGGYAQYVWADARHCLPVPSGWTMVEAASLPETLFTVWLNVFDAHKGQLKNDETLLIHAGASGIGVTAIQMAKAMEQKVIVTLRQMDKSQACLDLGADAVVALNEQWVEQVLAQTAGRGVDVVLDMLGASTAQGNLSVMARGGRLVWIAFLTGAKAEIKIPDIMAKEISLTGAFLRPQSAEVKARIAQELRTNILPKIEQGMIRPVIDAVFAMNDVRAAHERMESNQHIGKIILAG